MTHEQALEVKEILLQIKDTIPSNYIDRIHHYYQQFINPSEGKPCTCSPKNWQRFVFELRDKVEETLKSYEQRAIPIQTNNS
jgi:hypothetical protein